MKCLHFVIQTFVDVTFKKYCKEKNITLRKIIRRLWTLLSKLKTIENSKTFTISTKVNNKTFNYKNCEVYV